MVAAHEYGVRGPLLASSIPCHGLFTVQSVQKKNKIEKKSSMLHGSRSRPADVLSVQPCTFLSVRLLTCGEIANAPSHSFPRSERARGSRRPRSLDPLFRRVSKWWQGGAAPTFISVGPLVAAYLRWVIVRFEYVTCDDSRGWSTAALKMGWHFCRRGVRQY